MSEAYNNNNATAAAAATSNNLDVLLLAVSMAAPSPNSRSGTLSSSATNSHMKTAVGPSMSAPKSISDSHHQLLHANNRTSATLPLVTPPTTIELLDGHAAAADMPIFTEEPSSDMKRSHHDSFFTPSSSTLPAPKMTNNPSMFITNTNSLPIKKRFTNREGGPMVMSGTFVPNGGSTRLQSDVATTTTTQTTSTPPPPLNNGNNTKKEKKKYRKPSCSHPSCPNRVMNRGVCARHGARVRICSIPECSKYAQKGGVCIRHGAKKEYKRCSVEGCNARASAAGSIGRSSSGGRKSVCSRHALTCYSVGSVVVVPAAAAVADGGTREEARQDVNSGRTIDEEEHQKQQQRETF